MSIEGGMWRLCCASGALSENSLLWLIVTLSLYTLGNLIMLKLIRDMGMGVS